MSEQTNEAISRLLQTFVFGGAGSPSKQHTDFAGGHDESVSFISGILLSCSHEFRTGPHANYKAHLYSLKRDGVFDKVYTAFGVARPNDPFLSIGKYKDLSPHSLMMEIGKTMPETGGCTVCANYWETERHPQEARGQLPKFYTVWIRNVRDKLKEIYRYHHKSFVAGMLRKMPGTDYTFAELAVEAALFRKYAALCDRVNNDPKLLSVEFPNGEKKTISIDENSYHFGDHFVSVNGEKIELPFFVYEAVEEEDVNC